MVLISIPKASASWMDPNRPINALLQAQIRHFREAERELPAKYHSDIYVHAIKTEGEAAEYIRAVTEAIHAAHEEAADRRERRARPRKVVRIAAAASKPSRRGGKKTSRKSKKK